jgi:hypothetical protein
LSSRVAEARPRRRHARTAASLAVAVLALAGCSTAAPTLAPVTPAPTIDTANAAASLTRFNTLVRSQTTSMHLEQTTSVVAAAASQSVSLGSNYRMDVSGVDFAATIFAGNQTVEFRSIAGIGYVKAGTQPWVQAPLDPVLLSDIVNPWQYVSALDTLQAQSYTFNPREAYIFGITRPLPYQTEAMRTQGMTGQITSLRFMVRTDGVPVELTYNAEATGPTGSVKLATTLRASRVGEPVKIDLPVP